MTAPERKCPGCRRPFRATTANPWRPFCSERCQLIDLGEWFAARHAIPGEDGLGDGASDLSNPSDSEPSP